VLLRAGKNKIRGTAAVAKMKNLFVFLLILVAFVACAFIGFYLTKQIDSDPVGERSPQPVNTDGIEQRKIIIIHVDRLDTPQPKLVSVWFLSVLFMENTPPIVTFAPIYSIHGNTQRQQAVERSFSVDRQGTPGEPFWQVMRSNRIEWEGYLLIDDVGVGRVFQWLEDQPQPGTLNQRLFANCHRLPEVSQEAIERFDWQSFSPDHFRADLRLDVALAVWNRLIASEAVKCEVLPE
jgi:hypothetical protein